MNAAIARQEVKKLVGKSVYAIKNDGTIVTGKLKRISGNLIYIAPEGGKAHTKAFFAPLVLYDLLAIGAYGGFGFPGFYGGFGYPYFW
ncbi:MAG TPA: hypothetical protein VF260_05210 [Bacilli bacterium]